MDMIFRLIMAMLLLLFIGATFLIIEGSLNQEEKCKQSAYIMEKEYKFDKTQGCFIKHSVEGWVPLNFYENKKESDLIPIFIPITIK